ncbi:MAG TPA: S49 family peptidase [Gammaproteobacteria bacterium]
MTEQHEGGSGQVTSGAAPSGTSWERDLLNRLAFASLNEERRRRRWSIFFRILFFTYLFAIFFMAMPGGDRDGEGLIRKPHTAMVQIDGVISDGTEANAETIIKGLHKAFKDKQTKGVVLRVNSPGGSPVQSGIVYDEIMRLKKLHPDIKVYAVILDIGASGAYYIAAAADEIYVNQASIVGSIGVLMNGFGFVDGMKKLGVERRLLTAGENKGMLDPFSPLKEKDVTYIHSVLEQIHQQFIKAVKDGRGVRLKEDPELFSGKFWTGAQGIELGLADGLGDVDYVAREVIGAEEVVDFTAQPDLWERFADRFGASMAQGLGDKLGINSEPLGVR